MTLPEVGCQSADNDGVDTAMSDNTVVPLIQCELLCFVQQAYEHLLKICCDFFFQEGQDYLCTGDS